MRPAKSHAPESSHAEDSHGWLSASRSRGCLALTCPVTVDQSQRENECRHNERYHRLDWQSCAKISGNRWGLSGIWRTTGATLIVAPGWWMFGARRTLRRTSAVQPLGAMYALAAMRWQMRSARDPACGIAASGTSNSHFRFSWMC